MPTYPVTAIGATPVQASAVTTTLTSGVLVVADPANTKPVFVGNGSTVTPGTDALSGIAVMPGGSEFIPKEFFYTAGGSTALLSNVYLVAASGSNAVYVTPNGPQAGASGAASAVTSTPAASEVVLGKVVGVAAVPSANFTRPADTTAYASGDLVANNTTAGSVTPMSFTAARVAAGSGVIRRARLKKSTTTTTNASFRLHLYGALPTVTNGDNGAWLSPQSSYLGSIDLDISGTTGRVFSDAAGVGGTPAVGSEITFSLASGATVYGLLEARAAYTPGNAEVFTLELECFQN